MSAKTESKMACGAFSAKDAPEYEDLLQCMRCGFCLSTCPTFALTGRERSSPRGRVALARAVSEQELPFSEAIQEEAFFCLDCRACTSACPSGVRAGELMEICRSQSIQTKIETMPAWQKMFREFILEKMLVSPDLLETSMLPARLYQRLGVQWMVRNSGVMKLGPDWMEKAEAMMPKLSPPLRQEIPERVLAKGEHRGKVGFFLGCVMSLMYSEVSKETVRVLSDQGFEVVTPKSQKCCGAPHLTEGDRDTARQLALHNLDTFLAEDVDYIVTDCAGCGSALKEYEELLEGTADHSKLEAFRSKVRDVSEFLAEKGIRTEGLQSVDASVTYHEPCHLCHAQGISKQPREVIGSIPGVEFRDMNESSWCCGSAATWGLRFADESQQVLDRKLSNVEDTGADYLVTANPGCQLQLAWGLKKSGMKQKLIHIVELLGMAIPKN